MPFWHHIQTRTHDFFCDPLADFLRQICGLVHDGEGSGEGQNGAMIFDSDFLVFVTTFTLMAAAPGPGMVALVAGVLAFGVRTYIWFGAGMVVGDLVWLTLSFGGVALIAAQFPIIFDVIKWGGIVYLLFMALKIWRTPAKAPSSELHTAPGHKAGYLLAGLSMTMGNPKVALFYLALLPTIISPEGLTLQRILAVSLAIVMLLSCIIAMYMLAAGAIRRLISQPEAMQRINRLTALVLAGAALWIALR